MAKNSPSETALVSAVDPRESLRVDLDAEALALSARRANLFAQRKQLDLEIEAVESAIKIADDAIAALSSSLDASRERALVEATNG